MNYYVRVEGKWREQKLESWENYYESIRIY